MYHKVTENLYMRAPGVGVTKAPFVNFSTSKIFSLAKVPFRLFESRLYLTGATAAELWQYIADSKVHGANMGPIWGRQDPGGPHVGPMNFAIWDD